MPLFCRKQRLLVGFAALWMLAGCAGLAQPQAGTGPEMVYAISGSHELLRLEAAQPSRVIERKPLTGLAPGDALIGIDFLFFFCVLYALSRSGQLYRVDRANGVLSPVGAVTVALPLDGAVIGFDFNPTVDRIRVVTPSGHNLRLHPDTGAMVDGDATRDGVQPDGALRYVVGDVNFGSAPDIAGAAYTYNTRDETITTNYAIDRARGALVMQGSLEGAVPVVSPNTGQLRTVGALGLGALTDVAFDISDVANTALIAVRTASEPRTRLHRVDLATGRATDLGQVGDGSALIGVAIEP